VDFFVVDVETANPDLSSICSIGVVGFQEGQVSLIWHRLIDPEDYFCPINVSIHGITDELVDGAPTMPQVFPEVRHLLEGDVVVASHMPFDRAALCASAVRYGLRPLTCLWLDTARVVRRAWPQYSQRGYALKSITSVLDIAYQPHRADEDARAAGEVLLRAVHETGITPREWLGRSLQRIPLDHGKLTRDGDPEGPLAGESVVFTGALSISRREAADMAAKAGCAVCGGVSRATTILVIGDQDLRRLAGHDKSSKHRRAEILIAEGQPIRILRESDFLRLLQETASESRLRPA